MRDPRPRHRPPGPTIPPTGTGHLRCPGAAVALALLALLALETSNPSVALAFPAPPTFLSATIERAITPPPSSPPAARASIHARMVASLRQLDALPPAQARALLERLAAPLDDAPPGATGSTRSRVSFNPLLADPLSARRADFELARLDARPWRAPAPPLVVGCFVPVAPEDGAAPPTPRDALLSAHLAALGSTCDPQPVARSPGLAGAYDLSPLLPATPTTGALHLRVPLALAAPTRLGLGTSGDLVVSRWEHSPSSRPEHAWLGHALGLRGAFPDQVIADLAPGDATLFITLLAAPEDPPRLHLATFSTTDPGRLRADPAPPPTGPSRPLPLHDHAATDTLWGSILRRHLGLPEPWRPPEERLGRHVRPTSAAPHEPPLLTAAELLLALGAIPREEVRVSLLEQHRLRAPRPSDRALLTLALADLALDRGQLLRARDLLEEARAIAVAPDDPLQPHLRWLEARTARAGGRPELAFLAYDLPPPPPGFTTDALAAFMAPLSLLERNELASAALELGRADLSAALRVELATSMPGRLDLQSSAMAALLSAGSVEPSLELARGLAERHPDRPGFAVDAAERHLARGRPGQARALLDALDPLTLAAPRADPELFVRIGQLREALDEQALAISAFQRALEVSPGHLVARRHLERLEGAHPIPLTLDTAALADTPTVDPDASFEVLGEEVFVRVFSDGSSTRWVRRVLRAQNVPASRDARTHRIRFDPSRESVTVLSANVHRGARDQPGRTPGRARPNGRQPVFERRVHTLGEDWYGLYYDLRQLAIPFDHLDRGDLVEITWRVDPLGQLFPGVFDLFEVLADRVPKHRLTITVDHPTSLRLHERLALPDGFPADFSVDRADLPDGRRRVTLQGRALGALPTEPLAPGAAEIAPVWQVTSFGSWRELAGFYRRLLAPQRVVTEAMRELVDSLWRAEPGQPKDALLRRIVAWVTREIRYVGLEFGVHGYKPYRTDEVWRRRFGDCKDKATLLQTLLSLAGIDSELVLVRTRKQGRLAGALPSLALFDHVILWLPERHQLVDPTAFHHGLDELPREDQGAQILVLAPESAAADLALSPTDPPARNGIRGRYSVTIDRHGRGGIHAVVSMRGVHAPLYRSMLLEPATREKRLSEVLNRRYPGLDLLELSMSDPRDHGRPIELVFTAEVPQLASRADATPDRPGPGLQVPRPAGIDGQAERLASLDQRALPLVLGPPTRWDLHFRYVFPDGWAPRPLPTGGELETGFGRFRVAWNGEGNVIDVATELELSVDQVAPTDYPEFVRFIRAFDEAITPALIAAPPPYRSFSPAFAEPSGTAEAGPTGPAPPLRDRPAVSMPSPAHAPSPSPAP